MSNAFDDHETQLVDLDISSVDAELSATNEWLIRLRWLAGASVLTAALLAGRVMQLDLPVGPILAIGLGILAYNLVFYLINRRLVIIEASPTIYRRLAMAQIILDWLAIILLIHLSGGVESPVSYFFVFHIVVASSFFKRSVSLAFTILASISLAGIGLAEYSGILPHITIRHLQNTLLYRDPFYLTAVLVFFSSNVLIVRFLTTTISERLRRREQQVITLSRNLQLSSARLQALNESSRAINSTLELSEVLNRLVKNSTQVMNVRACSIRLLDKTGRQLEPVAVYGLSQEYLDKGPLILDNDPLDRRVLNGEVVNIPNVNDSKGRQHSLLQYPEWAMQEGFASMLSAPLIGKSTPLGVLRAYSDEIGHFGPDDEAFLSAIATQGSIAIENALTYQTVETLDATKSAFVRVFTHELRSPVSVIRSLLETIVSGYAGEITEQQEDILARTIRRVDFLRKLIDDLLDLAAGRVPEKISQTRNPIAIEPVINTIIQRFHVLAKDHEITLTLNKGYQGEISVLANPDELDRVFNNLISNAIKYTMPPGEVTISLFRNGGMAQVVVADTGIGIPKENLDQLFEEFFRAPNAKQIDRDGTGLGLAIVRDTVKGFGGDIKVESQVGIGSRFTVQIPLAAL